MKIRGLTLLEILVSLFLLTIAIAIALPILTRPREAVHKVNCASNLLQLGKAMELYAAQPGNGGLFPFLAPRSTDVEDQDSQQALTLLYKLYVNDIRIYSCPANPLPSELLQSVVPSDSPGWKSHSFTQAIPGTVGRSSSYGYSPGHRPEYRKTIVLGDRKGTGAKGNSDNHGRDKGQYVIFASGELEWRESNVNRMGKDDDSGEVLIDSDIYAPNTISPATRTDLESYLH